MNLWIDLRIDNPHEGLQQSTMYCEKPDPNKERGMPKKEKFLKQKTPTANAMRVSKG